MWITLHGETRLLYSKSENRGEDGRRVDLNFPKLSSLIRSVEK